MEENQGQGQEGATLRSILKKITVGECGATPDLEKLIAWKNEKGDGVPMPLLTVYGLVTAYKAGEAKDGKGPFVRFFGPMMKAINHATGQIFSAPQCILPGAAGDLLYGALSAKGDGEGGAIEFAFLIGAHYDSSAIAKYVYDIQQVVSLDQTDPLAKLEGQLKALSSSNVLSIADKSGVKSEADAEKGPAIKKKIA